jgi:hypothetical protein
LKFVPKILTAFDLIAMLVMLLLVSFFGWAALIGAARGVVGAARRSWHNAEIAWIIVGVSFVWVVLRWKKLNKLP